MKTKLSLSILIFAALCSLTVAQVPQGFNYQAVARLTTGDPIINTTLPVRITIQADSLGTSIIWQELHSSVTTNGFGLITLVLGRGTRQAASTVATFSAIDWTVTPKFIKTEINYSGWKTMGVTRLWSVPYSSIAEGLGGPVKKLAVKGVTALPDEALFEVKNKDGQTVFAVYNEGVRVYVSDGAKALKGGFAVGGFGTDKAESTKYMFVGKDSVRIYLDTNPLTKKLKGGFAVGGYDLTKGITVQDYLDVNSDSVRIYIDSNPATKGLKGGFAVGGYDMVKGTNANYMNVNTDASGIINPSQNRILWYPLKNAFLTGKVLIESPDSVGTNSFASGFESKAIGNYAQALGYRAIARGNYSTAIGLNSVANNSSFTLGGNSVASGLESYAFGGRCKAIGSYSFAFGVRARAIGVLSMSFGMNTVTNGYNSLAFGTETLADGNYSTVMGYYTTAYSGFETVFGRYNTAYTPLSITDWNANDRLFVIGNGLNSVSKSDAFVVLKNGNVGIGTSSPSYKLTVSGTTWCTSGAWTGSDLRWKKNIIEINNVLSNLLTLKPVTYQWKIDEFPEMNFTNDVQIGLIAQDVEKIFPNLVMTDNNGYKAVSYEKLSVVLLEAIKEQQQEIESYKSENDNLKSRLQSLQEKVDRIEAMLVKGEGN